MINLMNVIAKEKALRTSENVSRKDALLCDTSSFAAREAYNMIRTNIIFSLIDENNCRKIMFTSALPGEGKTTTCINMAITFAQTGAKVLLIDADLRKPRLDAYMEAKNKKGLSDVLGGFCNMEEAINRNENYKLDYMVSGPIPPNPTELLSSVAMEELLGKLGKEYDYIFLDTPPVTVVADAASLSKNVSGAVVVTRQNYSTHEMMTRALSALEFVGVKILGFVLNDVDNENKKGYYRKYGRKYGKKYGYYSYYSYYGAKNEKSATVKPKGKNSNPSEAV